MPETNITVASKMLSKLGEPAITAFSGTDAADHVNQLYETTILALLSMHDWTFAQKKIALIVDGAAPAAGWANGFTLPAIKTERVGQPLGFYLNGNVGQPRISDYEIENDWVYTNRPTLFCEYVSREDEDDWPGYFLMLAIEAGAAALALPIVESVSRENKHTARAFGTPSEKGRGGLFNVAVQADMIGQPTKSLLDHVDPIADIRFG